MMIFDFFHGIFIEVTGVRDTGNFLLFCAGYLALLYVATRDPI